MTFRVFTDGSHQVRAETCAVFVDISSEAALLFVHVGQSPVHGVAARVKPAVDGLSVTFCHRLWWFMQRMRG